MANPDGVKALVEELTEFKKIASDFSKDKSIPELVRVRNAATSKTLAYVIKRLQKLK